MNAETSLKLFEITQEFVLDRDKAKIFVSKIEETIDVKFKEETKDLATKLDILQTKSEISEAKSEILKWMFALFLPFYIGMIMFLIKQFL